MNVNRALLFGGALVAAFFILSDIAAATWFYPGYDYTSQQVSELSAIGAPSRDFWMLMEFPYNALTLAFRSRHLDGRARTHKSQVDCALGCALCYQ